MSTMRVMSTEQARQSVLTSTAANATRRSANDVDDLIHCGTAKNTAERQTKSQRPI